MSRRVLARRFSTVCTSLAKSTPLSPARLRKSSSIRSSSTSGFSNSSGITLGAAFKPAAEPPVGACGCPPTGAIGVIWLFPCGCEGEEAERVTGIAVESIGTTKGNGRGRRINGPKSVNNEFYDRLAPWQAKKCEFFYKLLQTNYLCLNKYSLRLLTCSGVIPLIWAASP